MNERKNEKSFLAQEWSPLFVVPGRGRTLIVCRTCSVIAQRPNYDHTLVENHYKSLTFSPLQANKISSVRESILSVVLIKTQTYIKVINYATNMLWKLRSSRYTLISETRRDERRVVNPWPLGLFYTAPWPDPALHRRKVWKTQRVPLQFCLMPNVFLSWILSKNINSSHSFHRSLFTYCFESTETLAIKQRLLRMLFLFRTVSAPRNIFLRDCWRKVTAIYSPGINPSRPHFTRGEFVPQRLSLGQLNHWLTTHEQEFSTNQGISLKQLCGSEKQIPIFSSWRVLALAW